MCRLANRALLLLIACLLLISFSAAQSSPGSDESGPPAKDSAQPSKQDKEKALKEQAVALLEQAIAESRSLSLPQNHVTVEQSALELLWKRDRTRAKALVADITGRILEMENRADSDQDSYRASTVYQLRMQMIQLISGLDPRMALNFLQATRPTSGTRDSAERQLEYNLTTQVASNDPRMALELARKSLNDGISFQLAGIYSSLNQKDPEAADQLAQDILSKLRSEDLTANRQSWYFAMNFLGQVAPQGSGQSGRHPRVVPSGGASNGDAGSNSGQSNPQIAKQLTDIIVGAVQSPNMPPDMLRALQPYADVIAQYAPGKAPQIQRQLSQVQNTDPQMRTWDEFNKANSQGSLEQSLAVAAQASPEVRSGMYQQVAWKAAGLGDYLRARQIVLDDISDPLQRTQMLREITKQAAFQAAGKGNFDLAHDLMQGFTPAEEHATVLAQIAQSATSQGQLKIARGILEEARGLLDSRPENATQLNALLQVAQAYANVAPSSGFQMVESLAGQLNELIAASAMIDGFAPYGRSFESGEMLLHNAYVPDSLLRPFADTLALLARADFARAKAVADSLQPTEARVLAHLSVAKHILVD